MQNKYSFQIKTDFLRATKGKIIFGFLMAILALSTAWGISKFVFNEIIDTVEQVSKPDKKLNLVNHIFNSVSRLDQKQKYLAIKKEEDSTFVGESRAIKLGLDTLSKLYANDSLQLKRINATKQLLAERDRQFMLYLTVRDSLLNSGSFANEIEKLNSIFADRALQADSAIYTTESKTSTQTIEEENRKGFFNKLFGKKKSDSYKLISEELKIRRDTLDEFAEDSILRSMESSLNDIKIQQELRSNKFIIKERNLANTSNQLTQQMLEVLEEVRSEAMAQLNERGKMARLVVNRGIKQITMVLIVFFILTVLLTYLILSDIGKSNRYRVALEKAKELTDYNARAKQRFLSNMSHEIRTPLQSIVGYAELLQENTLPDKKAVKAIRLSASHLLFIINEILDYSRIASGKFTLKSESFDAHEVVNEVLLVMHPLAEEKHLQLVADLNMEEPFWIKGDTFRMKQILYNLLGNAIKFTQEGEVKLAIDATRDHQQSELHIKISDSGIGISPEHLTNIFEEFNSGNLREASSFNSTGLGLSIVKQLVDLHGGQIRVESKENEGTTFDLVLIYQNSQQEILKEVLEKAETADFAKDKMVWIVDDDQLILDLCEMILAQHHIPHEAFNKPKDLLSYPIPENLGYVLMDMRMPEMNGLALFKLLKRRLPATVKFYAVTAQVLPLEQQDIMKAGFDGIINKPFSAQNLLKILPKQHLQFENLDTENLKKMTFGNQEQLKKVLKRFVEDCLADIALLKTELATKKNTDFSRLIVHRLAGRTGQIGYKGLSNRFRRIEQKLHNSESFVDGLAFEIEGELEKLNVFINHVKEEDYSI